MTAEEFFKKEDPENNYPYNGQPTDKWYFSEGDMIHFAERYYQEKMRTTNLESYKKGFDAATESLIAANKTVQNKNW